MHPNLPPRSEVRPADGIPWDRDRIITLLFDAGERALRLQKEIHPELKSDSSLVTEADREIEGMLAREFDRPREGTFLIGEETVSQKGEDYIGQALQGASFIVDPIDGTSPYAHGLPNWGVSIGLMEQGRLTQGAVYLPEYRVLVASDGDRVLEGTRPEGSDRWDWRYLPVPRPETGPSGIIAITQDLAKRGCVDLPNPVEALGAAVVPLVGLLQGRFLAYAGSLRLWDLAGSLPLLHRLHFLVARLQASPGTRLDMDVGPEGYLLDPRDPFRWGVRGGILVCPPSEEARIRGGLRI